MPDAVIIISHRMEQDAGGSTTLHMDIAYIILPLFLCSLNLNPAHGMAHITVPDAHVVNASDISLPMVIPMAKGICSQNPDMFTGAADLVSFRVFPDLMAMESSPPYKGAVKYGAVGGIRSPAVPVPYAFGIKGTVMGYDAVRINHMYIPAGAVFQSHTGKNHIPAVAPLLIWRGVPCREWFPVFHIPLFSLPGKPDSPSGARARKQITRSARDSSAAGNGPFPLITTFWQR